MAPVNHAFPFRWVLPPVQFLVCLALLWPVRSMLFVGATESNRLFYGPNQQIEITPDTQRAVDSVVGKWETRKAAPLVLDFPVLIAQLPYILVRSPKREWVPKGMFPDVWRALSWPFVGMFFWWFFGRSVEAVSAARRSLARPRITLAETSGALILSIVGLVALAGILTSTPDDRHDFQFLALIAGAILWGILATTTLTARFMQWRISKRRTAIA